MDQEWFLSRIKKIEEWMENTQVKLDNGVLIDLTSIIAHAIYKKDYKSLTQLKNTLVPMLYDLGQRADCLDVEASKTFGQLDSLRMMVVTTLFIMENEDVKFAVRLINGGERILKAINDTLPDKRKIFQSDIMYHPDIVGMEEKDISRILGALNELGVISISHKKQTIEKLPKMKKFFE